MKCRIFEMWDLESVHAGGQTAKKFNNTYSMTKLHSDHAKQPPPHPIPPPTPIHTNPHKHLPHPKIKKKKYHRTALNWLNHSMGILLCPGLTHYMENEYGTCIVLMSNYISTWKKKQKKPRGMQLALTCRSSWASTVKWLLAQLG